MNILVIDIGTSSMRGTLLNENAAELLKHQVFYSPDYISDILVEQDPAILQNALNEVCSAISASLKPVDVITFTSQRSSIMMLDYNNQPIGRAIMWQDKRTASKCVEMSTYNDIVIAKTGSKINPVYSASKMNWVRDNLPDVYSKTSKFIVIPDYINLLITNNLVTDHTYGSRSLLMNILNMQWDDELLSLWKIPRSKLLDLVMPGSQTGVVCREFSLATGLAEGIPVITAGGDQQCSAIGQGVIEQGSSQITAGSGAYIISASDCLPTEYHGNIIVGASAIPGKYILESSILTCSSAFNWYNREFYPETAQGNFSIIDKDISEAHHKSNRIIVLPYFQGRATPDWNSTATASFHHISLSTTKGEIALAILEGIGYEINENLTIASKYVGKINQIAISGGITNNPIFSQIISDITGQEIIKYKNAETTSIGAWIMASVATGMYDSYHSAFEASGQRHKTQRFKPVCPERYRESKEDFNSLYTKLYRAFQNSVTPENRAL